MPQVVDVSSQKVIDGNKKTMRNESDRDERRCMRGVTYRGAQGSPQYPPRSSGIELHNDPFSAVFGLV